ncbi:MAG: hypothetical protein K8R36_06580 [Planctomycetales bacterium]|nr:hypothetical protein [Planctomycetales bacterium]
MRCREFEDRMNDLLDQRLAPERDGLLVRHADGCLACRRLLDGQSALFSGLELCETPPLSSQFCSAVLVQAEVVPVAAIADTSHRRPAKWLGVVAAIVSLAAVVLVAVIVGLSRKQDPVRPVAKTPDQPVPKTIDVAKSPSPRPTRSQEIAQAIPTPRPEPTPQGKEDYQEYREMLNSVGAQFPIAVEHNPHTRHSLPRGTPLRLSSLRQRLYPQKP